MLVRNESQNDGQLFIIPENTDLNTTDNDMSQNWDGTESANSRHFTDAIYNRLPASLKEACDVLVDKNEKEVFLVGALGVLSGMLPNLRGNYMGSEVEANLYVYLLAAYGEGKSSLEFARKLAMPIHKQKKQEASRQIKSGEGSGLTNSQKAILKHFLPSNNSKSGVLQLLHENGGRGTLFETEGDTIADTLAQDYGNFSDVLRNAYHHQMVSFFRRGNNEDVEIECPCLSVVLSSTPDQMVKLIPSIENGLFSRFCYYKVESNPLFADVFNSRKKVYSSYFESLGNRLLNLYNTLSQRKEPLYFEITEEQKQNFLAHFRKLKEELTENASDKLGGSVNRLGVMAFRIMMILTALRHFDEERLNTDAIYCDDLDFDNALLIIEVFTQNMLQVFWKLNKRTNVSVNENPEADKAEQKRRCKELYLERTANGQNPDYRSIALEVLGTESKKQTAYRWIHE